MLAFLVYNLCVLYVIYKDDSFANIKKKGVCILSWASKCIIGLANIWGENFRNWELGKETKWLLVDLLRSP